MPSFENFERAAIAETDKVQDLSKKPKAQKSENERAREAGYVVRDDNEFLADQETPSHESDQNELPSDLLQEVADDGTVIKAPPIKFDPSIFLPKKRAS